MNKRPHKAAKDPKKTGPKRGDANPSKPGAKKPPFPAKKNK